MSLNTSSTTPAAEQIDRRLFVSRPRNTARTLDECQARSIGKFNESLFVRPENGKLSGRWFQRSSRFPARKKRISVTETPIAEFNNATDAMRYLVMRLEESKSHHDDHPPSDSSRD
jgi:hypothetical protein